MNAARGERRGFCPSVWTPMSSGDGLIVRLSPRAASLSAREVRALARAAASYGNGLLEITRRGKLQLRGIRENTLAALQSELDALGLAGSSALTVNPLAGLHPACAPLASLAQELETALARSGVRARLSDKFGVVLDSGGVLRELAADIRIELSAADPDYAELSVAAEPIARCHTRDCAEAAVTLAEQLAASSCDRMRELVRGGETHALRASLGRLSLPLAARSERAAAAPALIGFHGAPAWLGLGVPFGAAEPETWLAIAALAERFGTSEIRITPFRRVLLPGAGEAHASAITQLARDAGLILDPGDPLLRAVACPGAPACASAHGPTRPLARQLARDVLPLLAADARLHVSGCSKRCAHDGPATVTVVHDPAGSQFDFDLASGA